MRHRYKIRLPAQAVPVPSAFCFPIVYTNVLGGLDAVSGEYLEVAAVYGLTEAQKLRLIYIPSIRPNLNAALRIFPLATK